MAGCVDGLDGELVCCRVILGVSTGPLALMGAGGDPLYPAAEQPLPPRFLREPGTCPQASSRIAGDAFQTTNGLAQEAGSPWGSPGSSHPMPTPAWLHGPQPGPFWHPVSQRCTQPMHCWGSPGGSAGICTQEPGNGDLPLPAASCLRHAGWPRSGTHGAELLCQQPAGTAALGLSPCSAAPPPARLLAKCITLHSIKMSAFDTKYLWALR